MVGAGSVNNASAPLQCLSPFAGLCRVAGQRLISGVLLVQGLLFPYAGLAGRKVGFAA